ncbi:hypothetical protein ACH4C6_14870 [Streptomyces sp. NPDC017943]|uniref:hypothetical protein n=1 Tax=Streptomyces sp. NPDC017943 TaxID=3365019 RepID=UPI00379DE416
MTDLIPAAPGWYVHFQGDGAGELEPVIAWQPDTDHEGNPTLLPILPDSRGITPWLVPAQRFAEFELKVVYRPNHDPAEETES